MDTTNPQMWITSKENENMAYPPYTVPDYNEYNATQAQNQQAAQKAQGWEKATYANEQTTGGILAGCGNYFNNRELAQAALGKIPTTSLQDASVLVRNQSEQLEKLLTQLHSALFEPVPVPANQMQENDNPSTVEGNLHRAAHIAADAISTLENILTKIGGR